MTAAELAEKISGVLEGPSREITGAAALESASRNDLAFAGSEKAFDAARQSEAGCIVVPSAYVAPDGQAVIRSDSPRALFARALTHLYPETVVAPGIHSSSVIDPSAIVDATVEIGPLCAIGANSVVRGGTRIASGCYLGRGVRIGRDCILHAGVVIYDGTQVGDRVILHSGCVLGADGFGFVLQKGGWVKFPQVGHVEIEDDVEIGANSCVDRAALGRTRIGAGTKLDNMVHVGHNCDIGRNVVVAAQTGFSGSVVVGDGAVIGGQVGVGDKARIEPGVVLGSGSGVLTKKIVRAGQPLWGTPARPLRAYLEQLALFSHFPAMRAELKELRARLSDLESRIR